MRLAVVTVFYTFSMVQLTFARIHPGRVRRSAFAPVFSGLYFDLKHKSGQVQLLAQENRRLLRNISTAVQLTSSLGASLSRNVADMADVLQQLALQEEAEKKTSLGVAGRVKPQRFRNLAIEYNRQAANVHKETKHSDHRFDQVNNGHVEVSLAGQSVSFAFLSTPMAAFAAGCAFNLMTVLLCVLVGCKYCRHLRGRGPNKSVSINFASESTGLPSDMPTRRAAVLQSNGTMASPSLPSLSMTSAQLHTAREDDTQRIMAC